MKVIFVIDGISWFWVFNENFVVWEAWIEAEGEVAVRRPANDVSTLMEVQQQIMTRHTYR